MDTRQETKRFYDLVWPQLAVVLRTAFILTGSRFDAEDLAQDTMLKAFKAIKQFQDGSDVRAWLLAILRHVHVDRWRSRARDAANVSLEALAMEPAATLQVESSSENRESAGQALKDFSDAQVIDALQDLPEEIRWTLLLVDVEGLAQDEAARILDVPIGTIKSRAHRGRSMLRLALLPWARERRLVRE